MDDLDKTKSKQNKKDKEKGLWKLLGDWQQMQLAV